MSIPVTPVHRGLRWVLLLAVVLTVGVWSTPALAEELRGGDAVVVDESGGALAQGGSATWFSIRLPDGASCPGDSADDGYRVEGYVVPKGTEMGELTFGEVLPNGENMWPLWDADTDPYVGGFTSEAETGQPGLISELPRFSFGVMLPGEMAPGDYRLGIACSLEDATTRYWDTAFVVATDATDQPAQFTWTAPDGGDDSTGGSSVPVLAVAIGAFVVLVGGAVVAVRARTSSRSPSVTKETSRELVDS
jgi:hypothetical protein